MKGDVSTENRGGDHISHKFQNKKGGYFLIYWKYCSRNIIIEESPAEILYLSLAKNPTLQLGGHSSDTLLILILI